MRVEDAHIFVCEGIHAHQRITVTDNDIRRFLSTFHSSSCRFVYFTLVQVAMYVYTYIDCCVFNAVPPSFILGLGNIAILSYIVILKCHDNQYQSKILVS